MYRFTTPLLMLTLSACAPVTSNQLLPGAVTGNDGSTSSSPGMAEGGAGSSAQPPHTMSGNLPPEEQIRVGPGLSGDTCKPEAAQRYVGQAPSEAVVKAAMTATGAKTVRVIKDGMAVTMDYSGDRLNLQLDKNDNIIAVTCG